LTVERILAWADAHRKRTGSWPTSRSGPVADAPGEDWWNLNESLLHGYRGLGSGDSLPRLLARCRGRLNRRSQPKLSVAQVLTWADAHRQRTGRWPSAVARPVHEMPGLTWRAVNMALLMGHRGLPGGQSLAQLLGRERGKPSHATKSPLTVRQVLVWARAHHARKGRWPTANSGRIFEAPELTWMAVNASLSRGNRGLSGGSSLARLLRQHAPLRRGRTG
jgi:hypothetical protein